ncbi:MAG: SurA N-terminal domain-containing protein [Firmicutes bacterium]|nr:SurA N-terminal domain-containing protein [Bacillota bacterium]
MKGKFLWVAAITVILVLGVTLLASGQSLWHKFGEDDRRGEESGEQTVIATIQGEEYAVNAGFLQTTYSYYQLTPEPHDEAWVKEHFVAQELLYREAQSYGLAATPEEVDQYIAFLRENQNPPEAYDTLSEYLKGRGMTEEEYWQKSWGIYRKLVSMDKLDDKLSEDYFKQRPDATVEDYYEYYQNEYRPALFEKYQVKML